MERTLKVPSCLEANCATSAERRAWLQHLPEIVAQLEERWSLTIGPPFDGSEVSCAWVAPVQLRGNTAAVIKIGMPHFEGVQEIDGLLFWNGDVTVRLLDCDVHLGAMLLERCEPGTHLRVLPEVDQDVVIAGLLKRLWQARGAPPFRPLAALVERWTEETVSQMADWPDAALVRQGLDLWSELVRSTGREVPLASDLHAGNVLRAQRRPWLVIDPKPFVGDAAYDPTQHLLNCIDRLQSDFKGTVDRFADLLELDQERIRLWTFARLAAEPRHRWKNDTGFELARMIAP